VVAVEVDRVTDEVQAPPAHGCSCSSERKRPPEFFGRLLHKPILIKLAGAPSVSGELVAFSPYELVVRDSRGRDVLVFKHSITSIDLPDGWRRTPGPEVET
jgi:sRNA-binding regulator protein Hfq